MEEANTMTGQNASINVFVYGTLMKGNSNHRYLERAEFISSAKISGYDMYEVTEFYPGIIPGQGDIYGENKGRGA